MGNAPQSGRNGSEGRRRGPDRRRRSRGARSGAHAPHPGSRSCLRRAHRSRDGLCISAARGRRAVPRRRSSELPAPAVDGGDRCDAASGLVSAVDPDLHVVTTVGGGQHEYDLLLLALGARTIEAVPGTLTFTGPKEGPALARILKEAVNGEITSIAFAVPPGASWPMPLYELALLTRAYLVDRGTTGVEITLVTPEASPLEIFGATVGEVVAELLEARGIDLRLATTPVTFLGGSLEVEPPAGSRRIGSSRCPGSKARRCAAFTRICTGSSRWTSTEPSLLRTTSMRPGISPRSRSSRVVSRRSRPTRPRRRWRHRRALRLRRRRSGQSCAGCS